uniref:Putative ovule protein n=1 Tax=Solanum chacoense TaxID=4108 RepID=A0A0V0GU98_SOLCH
MLPDSKKKNMTNKLGWFRTISISEGFAHDNITSDRKHLPIIVFSTAKVKLSMTSVSSNLPL